MYIAIVILNWNGAAMMRRYLPTLLEYSEGDAVVWVADNASTDESMQMLSSGFPQVKTIQLDKNYGFAEGYNRALKQISADYYVLLNSDVEVTEQWLQPLLEYMDAHKDVAACQPKILSIADRGQFEYAGASGGYIDRFGYPFCRGRIFDTVERDEGQYDNIADLLWATGACLMIRAQDYHRVGGLDGRFFAHNEEIDLCWRLRQLGRRIVCIPQSHVYHVGGGTLPKSNPMKTYLNFRNNLTMLYKNLPSDELGTVMRWRWFLDYLAAFETLIFNHNWGDFKAIYRARRDFQAWKHRFDKDREQMESTRVISRLSERKYFSILWMYHVKGRKTFNSLVNQ
ncbi:MAG: glycosyltransferase family 2 protein [Bacteroidota bacterium]|nr:glycosyltransferase family 2 protein [Bacteroidota bacterium]